MGSHLFLAIDLGTSSVKAAVVNQRGEVLASTVKDYPLIYTQDNGIEQDPQSWWKAICEAVPIVLSHPRVNRQKIVAVANTAQWSGTVCLDKHGNPLHNAIIWMDCRGASEIAKIISGRVKVEGYSVNKLWRWIQRTGGAPGKSGKDPLAHILYVKKHKPKLYKETALFLEPKDYLNFLFSGKIASSYDTISLHWLTDNRDINHVTYDKSLLKITDLPREKFPDLYPATASLGKIKKDLAYLWQLPPETQVIVGSPDIPSAAVGSGAVLDYQTHLCLGTSSWLTCHVPFKKTSLTYNMAALPSALPGRYFVANEQESAGMCLKFLSQNMFPEGKEISELEEIARRAPSGSRKMLFTPWLNGERTPIENHFIRGGFHNISLHNTQSDFVRSVYEGVAYNSKWLLRSLEAVIKRPVKEINVIGGGAQSDLWCQIHADILNRTIKQVADPRHANSRGAAWIAALGLKLVTVEEIAQNTPICQVFTPEHADTRMHSENFVEFVNIYKSSHSIHKRLNLRSLSI